MASSLCGVAAVEGVELRLDLGGDPGQVGGVGRRGAGCRGARRGRGGRGRGAGGRRRRRQGARARRCCWWARRCSPSSASSRVDGLGAPVAVPVGDGEADGGCRGPPGADGQHRAELQLRGLADRVGTSWRRVSRDATTMLRSPWVVTSASDTPPASTRWTMMSTRLVDCSVVTSGRAVGLGLRMIWVPPSRSRPSLGSGPLALDGERKTRRRASRPAEHERRWRSQE